jgi:hypothetical protein
MGERHTETQLSGEADERLAEEEDELGLGLAEAYLPHPRLGLSVEEDATLREQSRER